MIYRLAGRRVRRSNVINALRRGSESSKRPKGGRTRGKAERR